MSREDDDARQYRCMKKYEEIVKQVFLMDELTDSMELSPKLSKHQRKSKGGSSSSSVGPAADQSKKAIANTITRFLNDLRSSPSDPNPRQSP